jgi:RNA polymerase sigma factor (sigma-70 family)
VKEQAEQSNIDEMLLPFLRTTDEAQAQSLLAQLLSLHAEPIIKKVIHNKLRLTASFMGSDADDLQSDATIHLLARLQECKADPQNGFINNFPNYVAVVAYRACYEFLRRKFPERHKLKNRLRYLLNHNQDFAIWESDEGRLLCGFRDWQGRREAENRLAAESFAGETSQQASLAEVLTAIFSYCNEPVEIDDLVSVIAGILGITDLQSKSKPAMATLEQLADTRMDVSKEFDQRAHLRKLWAEIGELPVKQRTALLLNLKDETGRGCIALFQLTGVATMRQMAEAMEMTIEDFAGLWNELPIEDARIADLLKLTRQQVINLRKSARERLARRLKMF